MVGSTAHLELDDTAHITIRALDDTGVAADTGDEKRGHVGSKPAAASIVSEGCTHRPGLNLGLELSDQFAVPLRFPVHGILQPLDLLLKVRDARFERLHPVIRCAAIGR
jgi:hypothetical protein